MNKLFATGLCTILLATPTIVSGQDKPKNKLEVVAAEDTVFTDHDAIYTLKKYYMDYGFSDRTHTTYVDKKLKPTGDFYDTYQHWLGMPLIIQGRVGTGNLDTIFENSYKTIIQSLRNAMSEKLAPGSRLYLEDKMTEKEYILVDNHPAIRSSIDIDMMDPNSKKKADPTLVMLLTVVKGENMTYGFTFGYRRFDNLSVLMARTLYDTVLNDFRSLK